MQDGPTFSGAFKKHAKTAETSATLLSTIQPSGFDRTIGPASFLAEKLAVIVKFAGCQLVYTRVKCAWMLGNDRNITNGGRNAQSRFSNC